MQLIKTKPFGKVQGTRWERWEATDAPYEVYMSEHGNDWFWDSTELEQQESIKLHKHVVKVLHLTPTELGIQTEEPHKAVDGVIRTVLSPAFFIDEDIVAPVVLSDVLYNLRRVAPTADSGYVVSVLQALSKAYVIRGGTEAEHGMHVRYNLGQALQKHPEPDERYKKGVVIQPRHVSYRFTYTSRLLPMLKQNVQ